MTREIPLTRDEVAIVDDDMYEYLIQWKWHAHTKGYPTRRNPSRKWIKMHMVVWSIKKGVVPNNRAIDHKNRNPLDCRIENLRIATYSQQQCNHGPHRNNTTGYKGVHRKAGKYQASIGKDGKHIYLGFFDSPDDAARAYNDAAVIYHGEFAYLNEVREK